METPEESPLRANTRSLSPSDLGVLGPSKERAGSSSQKPADTLGVPSPLQASGVVDLAPFAARLRSRPQLP